MKHHINGYAIDLRTLSAEEVRQLISATNERRERIDEELDSLNGELVRRGLHLALVR